MESKPSEAEKRWESGSRLILPTVFRCLHLFCLLLVNPQPPHNMNEPELIAYIANLAAEIETLTALIGS